MARHSGALRDSAGEQARMSDRYSRQTILPEVGEAGQARLRDACVFVIGAGGLGCAVLQYLCAAGLGALVIADPDRVEESNLHRQPIYRMEDVGLLKAQAAREALLRLNPGVRIEAVCERVTPSNVAHLVAAADLVVDAADSFAATYVASDACYRAGKILVSASVLGLSGYVGAFCGGAPSYRAVFPEMPRQAGSCAQSGVLGTAVGVMGTLQAHTVLTLLLGLQPSALGQLITVDFRTLRFGGFSFAAAHEPSEGALPFIAADQVAESDIVIDLRSLAEAPASDFVTAIRMDVAALERADSETETHFPPESRVVLCCRTGVRAWRAARVLQSRGHMNVALIALGG
ncbi:MAG: thiamine biosynthesis protein ThiF [Gammaproteobacteria bacterium]|jgi:molybdopterin/thiamine biosynthesis adenylyltransferase/rhodanese-related sulfurtransferase|nr:thiamine biosynthesis protein ThiF [Gammaproteobacteria bacterium]